METKFVVECNVCHQRYENWSGSTPCCGSLAYVVADDGSVSKDVSLYTSYGIIMFDFSNDK